MKKSPLNLRIKPELLKKLKEKASKENRTLSNMVETILNNSFKDLS